MNILIPIAHAATTATLGSIIEDKIVPLLDQVLVLIMAVAVVVFVWQVIRYFVLTAETDRKNAGLYVMYSIIGFFVVLSLWGIVNVLSGTFGISNTTNNPGTWASFRAIFPH
jgi:hypothetical protein